MGNYYHLYNDIRRYTTLTDIEKNKIIDTLSTAQCARDYSFLGYVNQILSFLNKDDTIKIFDNMIAHYPHSRSYYEDNLYETVKKAYDFDKDHVKNVILNRTDDAYDKTLLLFENITTEEEARGLRALAQRKYCPRIIHTSKYSPTEGAIKLLPPVMRLKVLETLSNGSHLAYNVFSNFKDPDEFKTLMFSSVLKHRERAEAVWNKYKEIAYIGLDAKITIKTNCPNCGEFNVDISSTRIRTKTGLANTQLWNCFRYNRCSLCGAANSTSQVIEHNKQVD